MKTDRRAFLQSSLGAAAAACTPGFLRPHASAAASRATSSPEGRLLNLHEAFASPVKIASIEVVSTQDVLFVRSTSTDGVTGTSVGNVRLPHLLSIMKGIVIPYFLGKDARDLEALVEGVYLQGSNYKYAGMPFWSGVGQVEWSLFDMLGQVANKPAAAFFGEIIRTEIPVYLTTFTRDKSPEETLDELVGPVAETGVGAVKLKIGGRMGPDVIPGRTETLIPLARKTFGDDMVLYVDANGSYDAAQAIEVGRLLEAHDYGFFEEPCPWEDFVATKQVADALTITVAGGEQDSSMPKFEWMIRNRAVDLIQPDLMYNGGFIRAVRVARMAAEAGLPITPHAPARGPEAATKLQFVAVVPNVGPHQEHRNAASPATWYTPSFDIKDGKVSLPAGPGLGVQYDPDIWRKAERIGT